MLAVKFSQTDGICGRIATQEVLAQATCQDMTRRRSQGRNYPKSVDTSYPVDTQYPLLENPRFVEEKPTNSRKYECLDTMYPYLSLHQLVHRRHRGGA